jgi:L-ascorbate metabolism protein UlaG (beta-lactamase superfamily)
MKHRKLKRIMVTLLIVSVSFIVVVTFFMRLPRFGKLPQGQRLARIENSPNYKNGAFQNLNPTQQITAEGGFLKIMNDFRKTKNRRPESLIPSVKTNLKNLPVDQNVLVWFGHSSYFIQISGKKFLVDPVFSGHASPFPFMIKSFKGSDIYTPADMPSIDYLVITHDHWDHLDYKTVKALKSKTAKIITGLGVGAHFERWGFEPEKIFEGDWGDSTQLSEGFKIYVTPARHFSGRGPKPNQSLWASFVLETPALRIFIGGDGGYDNHFAEIGKKFGSFDLAILENGQYNESWRFIHMLPSQFLPAGRDLKAKRILPVHSMKFALAHHTWDAPLKTLTELNRNEGLSIITPKIGEPVFLSDTTQKFDEWWKDMK